MTNEEFQKLVLEGLASMKQDISGVKQDISGVKQELSEVKYRLSGMEQKLDRLIEDNTSVQQVLGEHEIAIRSLRRKPV